MKKLVPLALVAVSFFGLSAFKLFPSRAEMNDEAASKAADKVMIAAFWPDPFGHTRTTTQEWETKVEADSVQIQHTEYLFAQSMAHFYEKTAAADSSVDEVALKYIETAKSRGNTVKQFKSPVNTAIFKMFRDPDDTPKAIAVLSDRDPALIEFSPEGRVISALTRVSKAASNMATVRRHYFSRIYLDPNNRWIENNLSNRLLEDNLIGIR